MSSLGERKSNPGEPRAHPRGDVKDRQAGAGEDAEELGSAGGNAERCGGCSRRPGRSSERWTQSDRLTQQRQPEAPALRERGRTSRLTHRTAAGHEGQRELAAQSHEWTNVNKPWWTRRNVTQPRRGRRRGREPTQVSLEHVILSERSQTRPQGVIPLTGSIRDKSRDGAGGRQGPGPDRAVATLLGAGCLLLGL